MMPFALARPDSLADATRMARADDGAAFLAGGQSLLRDMKRGLRRHATLVDLGHLLGRAITVEGDCVRVEAAATHAEVASSALVQGALPLLSGMAGHIADPLVRHRATIGGAFAVDEAAGDYPALALALDATVVTTRRQLAADEFFTGLGATALEAGEIITAVRFPKPSRAAYVKMLNPAARYALVGACVAVDAGGVLRLAITGASVSGAFRWTEGERALVEALGPDALDTVALPPVTWREDLFADGEYRAHLARVMARRAVKAALEGTAVTVFSHGAPIPGGAPRQ